MFLDFLFLGALSFPFPSGNSLLSEQAMQRKIDIYSQAKLMVPDFIFKKRLI